MGKQISVEDSKNILSSEYWEHNLETDSKSTKGLITEDQFRKLLSDRLPHQKIADELNRLAFHSEIKVGNEFLPNDAIRLKTLELVLNKLYPKQDTFDSKPIKPIINVTLHQ